MKNKKIFWVIVILAISVLIVTSIIVVINKKDTKNNGRNSDECIAVFYGGGGEIHHITYIYKIDNGQSGYSFNYVNITQTTKFWGSSEWNTKITEQGSIESKNDVFEVAKENGAYSFVKLPNSDKTYTIEEYMQMFLMD